MLKALFALAVLAGLCTGGSTLLDSYQRLAPPVLALTAAP